MTAWQPEHDRLLWQLEQQELRALSWGRIDGAMTRDEVETLAHSALTSHSDPISVLEDLIGWELLSDLGESDELYRTRFAESVRLLARNRRAF